MFRKTWNDAFARAWVLILGLLGVALTVLGLVSWKRVRGTLPNTNRLLIVRGPGSARGGVMMVSMLALILGGILAAAFPGIASRGTATLVAVSGAYVLFVALLAASILLPSVVLGRARQSFRRRIQTDPGLRTAVEGDLAIWRDPYGNAGYGPLQMGKRWVFDGHIAGIGTESGLRAVVGLWQQSPFGPFADAMVELPSGHRVLLAPTAEIGEFIAAVYNFDETQVLDVAASHGARRLRVDAGPLRIRAAIGGRTRLGGAVRLIPRPVAVHPLWLRAVNPLAARLSPGARTTGAAKGGRQEYYGVTDLHRIDAADVDWNGAGAGALAAIRPAVTFGFSSVPPAPSLARVRTTVVQSKAGGKQSPHKLPRPASDFARTERSIRIAPGAA